MSTLSGNAVPENANTVIFGDGKTVTDKTDQELTDLLTYWGHPRHPQRVADAVRAEIARRAFHNDGEQDAR